MTIYSNNHYNIIVNKSEEDGRLKYLIVNKKFGVVETETTLYPQAIKYAEDLSTAIEALVDEAAVNKSTNNPTYH